jgi:hypothetical protein
MLTDSEKLDRILALLEARPAAAPAQAAGAVADDADLDGQYGNEKIRKMPSAKYWQGADFTDCVMSDCPADFLRAFAKYKGACAYMNEKNADPEKAKYIGYDRKSAARALGWAARNEGKPAPKAKADAFDGDDAELPF